ncbi:hypothetical protein [Streptomyces kurssanovii]|uniref:Uncharacterized protein n=1 Tax=Streptomyces kurssanovii TaxID=67312 RepID=A0ABV3HR84_9ACTN
MTETEVALLVAAIGAGAAIIAGMMAHSATMRQPEKSFSAQREQALWAHRRDLYTQFLLTAKEYIRLYDRTGGRYEGIPASIERLEDLYSQMELESTSREILSMARSIIEHFREIRSLASTYERETDPPYVDTLRTRLRDENSDLRNSVRFMQSAVHSELDR